MKLTTNLLVLVLGAMIATGCARGPTPAKLPRPDVGKLIERDMAFAAAAKARGVAEAFREFAAPNAVSFPVGESPVHGREAIYQSMLHVSPGELLWTPSAADIAEAGDLGYTWGTFELRTKDADGQPVSRHGKYVTVWKRQPDGSWKFVADIGNSGPPPQ